jgi:hypothetical protein
MSGCSYSSSRKSSRIKGSITCQTLKSALLCLSTLHAGERDSLLTVGIGAVPSNAPSGLCGPTPVLYLKNLEIYFSQDLQNLETVPPKLHQ